MGRIQVTASQSFAAWQPLPNGDYEFQFDEVTEGMTSHNNPQLKIKMSVMTGPHAGKTCMHFVVITEKSGGFVKELVEATGVEYEQEETEEINEEDGKPFLNIAFDSDDLIGKTAMAKCRLTEYEGKEQNKFTNFRPIQAAESPAPSRTASKPAAAAKLATAAKPAANAGRQPPAAGAQQRRSRV